MYELVETGDKEIDGVTCWAGWIWCWSGDESGEPLERDDRSEPDEWMECSCTGIILATCLKTKRCLLLFDKVPAGKQHCRWLGRGRNTYIVLGKQTRAELQVIVQIERAPRFKARTECCHCRGLGQLSHALHAPELPLGVLRGHPGASSGAAAMVVVGGRSHVGSSGSMLLLVLLLLVVCVEVCRHGEGVDWKRVIGGAPSGRAGCGVMQVVKQEREE